MFSRDVVIVGGCGHVGLPLSLALAESGLTVTAYDANPSAVATVMSGTMPFDEPGAPPLLSKLLGSGQFDASSDPASVSAAEIVVVVIGTPVDEHLNPNPQAVSRVVDELGGHLRDGQMIVLRSTIYPGVTRLVDTVVKRMGRVIDVAFCPERIAEGKALTELYELPQLVSGCSDTAIERASMLFRRLTDQIVVVEPEEAELSKLFTNTWRYIKFAAANQFYMIANDYGLDFERIRQAITFDYPRAADMPSAGFAAGPCLFKDTMQLAAFNNNNFTLGHSAMMVNEGLPLYLVARMEQRFDLPNTKVGILGMAFKAESDDTRSSLSYKMRRILQFKALDVLCTDPYVTTDPSLVSLERVLEEADVIVVGAPHSPYRQLRPTLPSIDIWNVFGRGVLV
jgi:UDP-N-acetyl-D-mannosaminuronic acid dehydrogenase